MIYFSYTGESDKRLLDFFDQSEERIMSAIAPALQLAMEDLKTYIQANKLQGQVLKSHKNGAGLAGSLNVRMENNGLSIAGYVGTAIVYAKIHEYGFNRSENVRSFTRMQTMAWGRSISPRQVTVAAFTRTMTMPPRPYMAPSLEEKKEAIMDRLRDAIFKAIQENA